MTYIRKNQLPLMPLLLTAAYAAPLAAHHSASFFDIGTEVVHENITVIEFLVANPHGVLVYTVTGDDGVEVQWQAELPSANFTRRGGISAAMLSPGDRVTEVVAWPGIPGRIEENTTRLKSMEFTNGDVAEFTPVSATLTKNGE